MPIFQHRFVNSHKMHKTVEKAKIQVKKRLHTVLRDQRHVHCNIYFQLAPIGISRLLKFRHLFIVFSRNERSHPNFVSACLQPREIEIFRGDCKLPASLVFCFLFFQGLWASFSCPSATSFLLSFVASFLVIDVLGFSLNCVYSDCIRKKGNAVQMQTGVRLFGRAKRNHIIAHHVRRFAFSIVHDHSFQIVVVLILDRAWPVWSGCKMSYLCYITGTTIVLMLFASTTLNRLSFGMLTMGIAIFHWLV